MSDSKTDKTRLSLLTPDEPPAVEVVNGGGSSSVVLVCDHASNRVPKQLGMLGLDAGQLAAHIGWDPGAAEVARQLSTCLDAPLLLSGYSRLVIDCNRPLESIESIPEQSAGITIPGNCELTFEEKELRRNALFRPYHAAIDNLLDSRVQQPTLLLSIHSFTPVLNMRSRPWEVGVCYGHRREFAALMLESLTRSGDLTVGDNEPYPIEDEIDYTIPVHGEGRGIPSVMIEIRQDQVRTVAEVAALSARLVEGYQLIEAEALKIHTL